jgi:hypothetical protein
MKTTLTVWIMVAATCWLAPSLHAQITGEVPEVDDTLIIFEPAMPLMAEQVDVNSIRQALGFDLAFSGSGWGVGGFYHYRVFDNATVFTNFIFTGRRNTDEFENAWYGPVPVVSNKVNRLFMVPFTLGVNYRLFSETLQETFRPFVSVGVTPTLILQTPYIRDGIYYEFFQSFGQMQTHFRWGASFCIGSMFGDPTEGNIIGVSMRYYTIPYGGDGLESIKGSPITNFGGVLLTLSLGMAY